MSINPFNKIELFTTVATINELTDRYKRYEFSLNSMQDYGLLKFKTVVDLHKESLRLMEQGKRLNLSPSWKNSAEKIMGNIHLGNMQGVETACLELQFELLHRVDANISIEFISPALITL